MTSFLLWFLGIWWGTAFVTAIGLMVTSKVRKTLRAKRHLGGFPHISRTDVDLGEGSTATVYTIGSELFDDMIAEIERATTTVMLESFIIKGDDEGRRFHTALRAAAARGVDVHLVYDGFANTVVRPSFFRFTEANVHVFRFPIFRIRIGLPRLRPWGRDHRKLLVVDGRVGFVGGYNIGTLYRTEWRDTHLRVRGPAVWELENAFVDFWNANHKRHEHKLDNSTESTWEPTVRAERNVPSQLVFPIRSMYLEAIDRAQHSIRLTAAYFIPDHDILAALYDARRRGVEIDILVPRVSNHVVADWISRGFFSELIDQGVRIHRYDGWMIHAKTATIDGQWSSVGTANIDRLSLSWNYEINLEIHGEPMAAHLEKVFATDLTNAGLLTAEEWNRRALGKKACEWLLRPLRFLL